MNKIYKIETLPFDWLELLCPLEEAARLLAKLEEVSDEYNLRVLVEHANATIKEPLRQEPRVLILPRMDSWAVVLLVKVDNNGTCYWFSTDQLALAAVQMMMEDY